MEDLGIWKGPGAFWELGSALLVLVITRGRWEVTSTSDWASPNCLDNPDEDPVTTAERET